MKGSMEGAGQGEGLFGKGKGGNQMMVEKRKTPSTESEAPEAGLCSYSTTHTFESYISLHIQTKGGVLPFQMFQEGLEEFMSVWQQMLLHISVASME
ncbi:hypothetical protein JRQ81_019220 [Phrynocephalus forsythii]|uniref:Uncharacterized protein n=1 Tax=Phrynocephalus forsythii TaxID=171643 RepID=A0A9Q0XLZ0_9SAUR|nr:hypothetical protein JRQ81_019220 [Phrynocephalus forsythii]